MWIADTTLAKVERERDFYRTLLDLGKADNVRTFLSRALELVVDITRATKGYIELRKYIEISAENPEGDQLYLVDEIGEYRISCAGKVGYPFFGQLILDCLHRTENAMTQEHTFKAAELCLKAQAMAVRLSELSNALYTKVPTVERLDPKTTPPKPGKLLWTRSHMAFSWLLSIAQAWSRRGCQGL